MLQETTAWLGHQSPTGCTKCLCAMLSGTISRSMRSFPQTQSSPLSFFPLLCLYVSVYFLVALLVSLSQPLPICMYLIYSNLQTGFDSHMSSWHLAVYPRPETMLFLLLGPHISIPIFIWNHPFLLSQCSAGPPAVVWRPSTPALNLTYLFLNPVPLVSQ